MSVAEARLAADALSRLPKAQKLAVLVLLRSVMDAAFTTADGYAKLGANPYYQGAADGLRVFANQLKSTLESVT